MPPALASADISVRPERGVCLQGRFRPGLRRYFHQIPLDQKCAVDTPLIERMHDGGVTIHVEHRIQMAVDCECGVTVEACDEEELFDELLEHIAAAHETGLGREPAAMLTEAYPAQP